LAMIVLVLSGVFIIEFSVRPANADAVTIYINFDGSVNPSTAPIHTSDNVTYAITGNISYPTYYGIVVQRSNIIIDGNGYTVHGNESGCGLGWNGYNNITIKNTNINSFSSGIWFASSSNSNISSNSFAANYDGILLQLCYNTSLSGNNIAANTGDGIVLASASNYTSVRENNIRANSRDGIEVIDYSNHNVISGNNITANNNNGQQHGKRKAARLP
jgi:parallel beta-helix repeat protein